MSSLIFATDENQVLVATDTLAVNPEGEPFCYTSKAIHIPHLRVIIAGTGAGGFANEWALIVSTRMVVKGIQNLNTHTPNGLRELWIKYTSEYKSLVNFSTTVYQFGLSEANDSVALYAYRSVNNFESEKLGYGTAVKPECSLPKGDLIQSLPVMMEEQRSIQLSLPKESRLFIGGEIQVLHLTKNGCESYMVYRFSDFKKNESDIFDRQKSSKTHTI